MRTVDIGRLGEKIAARSLRKSGYRIIGTNVHISHNEIDIIAKNREYLVFVEVKTRSTNASFESDFGTPASAVDKHKIKRTLDAARVYLRDRDNERHVRGRQPRFDVFEVYLDRDGHKLLKTNHIENAFGANK